MEISDNIIGKLSEKEYFEWKATMLEYRLEDEKTKNRHLLHGTMEKDMEINKLKMQMHLAVIERQKEGLAKKKELLEKFYDKIKSKKGFDLRNCAIDEISLEVRDLTNN